MAISATENPLGKVFTSDYQLTIPSFQRAYTWQAENIEQLVNDLQDACADPDTPYFLGSLILVKDGPTQYQVIDGQQRLISLSIIVSVLRELEDDPDLIDSLNDLILEPGDKLRGIKAEPRLTLRERDTDFFRMYVQEGNLEGLFDLRDNDIASHAQRNIAVNTRRTFDLLAAMDAKDRRRFASYLVNGVTLVIVTTDDLAGAHRIFDVMNMRGVPLTASDVFKAKTIAEISPAARNAYATRWDDIMDPLGEELHPLVAPSGSGIEVVANAHLGSGGVQNVCAVAVGSHPRVEHFLSRSFAPADVLAFALAGLLDAILTQNGEAVGAIGAGVGSGLCNFLCALLSGCVQVCIAQSQRGEAVLGALVVHQSQELLCELVVAGVGSVGEDHDPVVAVLAAFVVADANMGGVLAHHAGTEEIVTVPSFEDIFSGIGSCPVVLANFDLVDAVLSEDGELAGAIGAVVGVVGCQLFGAGLSGCVQLGAADGQRSDAIGCALVVDEAQQLGAIGSCSVCGHCHDHHQAEHCSAQEQVLQDVFRSVTHRITLF